MTEEESTDYGVDFRNPGRRLTKAEKKAREKWLRQQRAAQKQKAEAKSS